MVVNAVKIIQYASHCVAVSMSFSWTALEEQKAG